METVTDTTNFDQVIEELQLKPINSGACTGEKWLNTSGNLLDSNSPVDGRLIAQVQLASVKDYDLVVKTAQKAFIEWRTWPAPKRGEVVRQIGNELRKHLDLEKEKLKKKRVIWHKKLAMN